jgi:hypothetical protein
MNTIKFEGVGGVVEDVDLNVNPSWEIIDGYLFRGFPQTLRWESQGAALMPRYEHELTLTEKDGRLFMSKDGGDPEPTTPWHVARVVKNGNCRFWVHKVVVC